MRIVTRPDFDGIVCAVLLYDKVSVTEPTRWVEPNEIQRNAVEIKHGDILANLPFHNNCSMWFDHHYSNKIDIPFKGLYQLAPSAARVIYHYYNGKFSTDFSKLVYETDRIDSAELSYDEILHPENYPYLILSMTLSNRDSSEEVYWNMLVELLGSLDITTILQHPEVNRRCQETIRQNERYRDLLIRHTQLKGTVTVSDFRKLNPAPSGNRYLVYSLFPESCVNVKIRYDKDDKNKIAVSVGHSIINQTCNVNIGLMLSRFDGGGHRGAGACRFSADKADQYIPAIIEILMNNQSNEQE